jgi:hypothetical protein
VVSRGEWISVAIWAAFWILSEGLSAFARADANVEDGVETDWSKEEVLLWISGGVFWGIAMTDWRVLLSPLFDLTIIAFGGTVAVVALLRLKTKHKPSENATRLPR